MKETEQILRTHSARYPKMQPTDAVKLLYQNEFGGGHLIRNEASCLAYLRQEYATVEKDPAAPLWEDIGNGIVRVYLAPWPEAELDRLGRAFIRSAAAHTGDIAAFRQKLDVLKDLTARGFFSFTAEELAACLDAYEKAGFPAVSHSPEYRKAYRPAYRVVRKEFL